MAESWYMIEGVNPEPWVASEGAIGRKNGKIFVMFHKPDGLRFYQEAVKSYMADYYPEISLSIEDVPIALKFYFWRELPVYEGESKKVQKHIADATNLQKALEDALQGILYENDRSVRGIQTVVMEQTSSTSPRILICVTDFASWLPDRELATKMATSMTKPVIHEVKPDYDRPPVTEF